MLHLGHYADTLRHVQANLILTSPPYNIGSKSPKILTNRKYGGYDQKSWGAIEGYPDKLPEHTYQEEQKDFLRWCSVHITTRGSVLYNHKPRHQKGSLIHPFSWFPLDV